MQKMTLTRKELEVFAKRSWGFSKTALRRMSTLLLVQLLQMKLRGDQGVHDMAHEVHFLEDQYYNDEYRTQSLEAVRPSREWIVFKTHNGAKYYLTVACLGEANDCVNQRIADACSFDFPFLQGHA